MADTKHKPEETFRSYKTDESKHYAQMRMAYHPSVYECVIAHHTATGGHLDSLLDVGCGPGLATRDIAPHFDHVTGIDASEAMIEVARGANIATKTSEPARFEVTSAEDMADIESNSIDLITAAQAVHWFDMSGFWKRAAQVLKPGGSVAMWTSGEMAAHPDTPNAAAINELFEKFKTEDLGPYFERGNYLVKDGLKSLPMPWDSTPPVEAFGRDSLYRKEWGPDELFHVGEDVPVSLDFIEKAFATSSPVSRWRKAHPETKGTEQDVVRALRNDIAKLLREAGVPEGKNVLRGAAQGVVIMVKKSAVE